MTHKIQTSFAIVATFFLTSCGGDTSALLAPPSRTIDLRVTAEIETGVNAKHVTVIPNDVAPWLSHIILIGEDGELYQTALDSGKAKALSAKAVDAVGLMREKAAGVVLTLSEAGTVSALIETDDAGNLGAITVSANLPTLANFCAADQAPRDTVHAMSTDGDILSIAVLVQESQIILSEANRIEGQKGAADCIVRNDIAQFQNGASGAAQLGVLNFSGAQSTISAAATGELTWRGDTDAALITITPGLSTPGLSKASAIHITSDSLGGAFRDGALIIADAQEPRLVMISAGFAQNTIGAVLAPPEINE